MDFGSSSCIPILISGNKQGYLVGMIVKIPKRLVKGDNLMKIMNAIMQTMYEYVKHQDYIRYNSLYKMSKR